MQTAIVVATLVFTEAMLRIADFRDLRDGYGRGYPQVFRYDSEIGWFPVPGSVGPFQGIYRTIGVAHNSLGLRDVELGPDPRPTVLVIGDSLVWGFDSEANERFTERLREQLPSLRIVNAGVPGYGTDQELLLLKRIWNAVRPAAVVLIFCVANDREDNTTNRRYGGYMKPYLVQGADGQWRFAGQPVPWSRFAYFNESPLVHNVWLARLAVSAFVQVRFPAIFVPDPTEQLVGMMKDFVEARSAKFLVGLQMHEPQLESFLQARGVSYTSFDDAVPYSYDLVHWTPAGQEMVARRLLTLLKEAGIAH